MNWIECTSAVHGKREKINLDNVAKFAEHPSGTLVIFAGGGDGTTTIVNENIDDLVAATLVG